MSLVFAAFVPHPPVIHETVGKEKTEDVSGTRQAFDLLRDELYIARPETLIIITPHGREHSHSFEVMGHPTIGIDISFFGDLVTNAEFNTDVAMVSSIREAADRAKIPLRIDGRARCDYGASIPLLTLDGDIQSVVVIRTADLNAKAHLDFGYMLKDCILSQNKRVGLIATGDLSHALTDQSPAGLQADAHIFDETITDILASGHLSRLMNIDPQLIELAATCAYQPLLMLAGVLSRVKTHPHVLCYEAPHGVGYITVQFALH